MAFNNLGTPTWLAPGKSIFWWYTFGDNRGAQYAMANCKSPDGDMQTLQQGDELQDNGSVKYFVSFTNNGPEPCFHNLNGGGLT